jgi:Holliday junction resolvase RusA-like endonuclease
MKKTFLINPVAKPRMTRSDRWKKRPCVIKYWEYKDKLKEFLNLYGPEIDDVIKVKFGVPIPKSWSKKKKQEMQEKPHQQRPDVDNLVKGVMDSLFQEDSHIHTIEAQKVWSDVGYIEFYY